MRFRFFFILLAFLLITDVLTAQTDPETESLGLPGDNLNLYAALKLFQECSTLEEFEQKLNDEEQKINNLDLDENGETDYITITDNVKDNVHSIVLEVAINQDEKQGVAVFIVTRESDNKVLIQVVGDEDLYGKDYIIEPQYDDVSEGTPNPGYQGNDVKSQPAQPPGYEISTTSTIQIYSWPIIQYVYVPTYNPWRSPWYWGNYPGWWRPWRPSWWHSYYGYHNHWNYYYYGYYRRWGWYRNNSWYGWYYGNNGWRRRSNYYYNNYHAGNYRKTYTHPEAVAEGSANFVKKYPTAPTVNKKIPVAKVPTFKPDIVKPIARPGTTEPGITNPSVTKPSTKPVTSKPTPKPVPDKPTTKPVAPKPAPDRPTNKPVTPKPTPKPIPDKPSTKPVAPKPTPKPVVTKPAPKPVPNQGTKPVPPKTTVPAKTPPPAKQAPKPANTGGA